MTQTTKAATDRRAAVYRLYDEAGALLYIGSAYDPDHRCKSHRDKAWWPEVARREDEWHQDRWTAYAEETKAIKAEQPKGNVMNTPGYRAECRRRAKEDPVRRACIMAGVAAAAGAPRETVDAILRQEIGWRGNAVVPFD